MEYPPVTIVMTTYFKDEQRKKVAERTLQTWILNLKYAGKLYLCVSDDGSIVDWNPEEWWGNENIFYTRQERHGVGASLNAGFEKAFDISPLVLYAVDDWELRESFDITPWVQVLLEREDIGCVRLGPPHPYLRGEIMPVTENWQGWVILLEHYALAVGHRPEIFHKRYIDCYGWFEEDTNAQECERLASVAYGNNPAGVTIAYALPHPWFHYHLDVLPSTSHIEPGADNV